MVCHPEQPGSPARPHLPDGVGKRGICSLLNVKRMASKLASTDGAEIAEAALVLPLVFMLLLGIVWFGRAFNIYSTITQAAQQGAITAARASCATCGNDSTPMPRYQCGLRGDARRPISIPLRFPQTPILLLPMSCVNPPVSCTGTNITICRPVLLNPAAGIQPAQCGTIVSFQYPFQFYLPFTSLNMQQIALSAQAQSRMEN